MRTSPVVVRFDTAVSEMLGQMAAAKTTSALVVDESGKLAGIVTEQDVARRIALRCTGGEPATTVMTSPVVAVGVDDYLYTAIARMRRFRWRHLPAVDGDGRPVGEIVLQDALTIAGEQIIRQIERITHEGSLDGLREVKAAQVDVAADLLEDNVPAPEIQALITDINRDIHRRILTARIASMNDQGWGEPPVPFAAIVMGSGGRGENYLFPDQDNGFVLDDYPDRDHNRIDGYFIELAERMIQDLNAVGFPYCNGYVMATNPVWRKSRRQWRDQLLVWGRKRGAIALQFSDIFFDFHGVYGRLDFAEDLRRHAIAMIGNSPAYLQGMEQVVRDFGVALGWFGRFITEKENPEHMGAINLKHAGTLPLVSWIRLLALRAGIEEASTLKRIARLHDAGVLGVDEQDYLVGAYRHITKLLLRQQLADFKSARKVGNYVHPDRLSEREKDILVDSFKAIDALGERVHTEFTAEIF